MTEINTPNNENQEAIKTDLEKLVRNYRTERYFDLHTAIGTGVCSVVGMISLLHYIGTNNKYSAYVAFGSMALSSTLSLTRIAYDFFHMDDFYNNLSTLARTVGTQRGK